MSLIRHEYTCCCNVGPCIQGSLYCIWHTTGLIGQHSFGSVEQIFVDLIPKFLFLTGSFAKRTSLVAACDFIEEMFFGLNWKTVKKLIGVQILRKLLAKI